MKELKDWGFKELVDWARGYVLVGIGKGDFDGAIMSVIMTTFQWKEHKDEQQAKKEKKRKRRKK